MVSKDLYLNYNNWKSKVKNEKEKIYELEDAEMENVLEYYSIMQNICLQSGYLVAVSSILAGFFANAKYFVGMTMVLSFFICVICPIYFGFKKLHALKCSSQNLITERSNLYKSCTALMEECNMAVVASHCKDPQDEFQEIKDFEIEKVKRFKNEDDVLVYQMKHYIKFSLAIGFAGFIYAVMFLIAFYVCFQVPNKPTGELAFDSKDVIKSFGGIDLKSFPRHILLGARKVMSDRLPGKETL